MPSRYLIGIDLGTTNSVAAYIDNEEGTEEQRPIRVLQVPQLAAPGEVRAIASLPSFLYFPTTEELAAGGVSATWEEDPPMVTGLLAREQGALVPTRQVSSAKSWLSHAGADRRARILPALAEPPQPTISPVEASARYLMHLRDAWNASLGKDAENRFEHQEIVLTVPASFDEVARELTVEAAQLAGITSLTLLEEPLAAFYAWIASNDRAGEVRKEQQLGDDELILVCDIGGGTTDFSLVRTRHLHGEVQFERTAIGEHLLLGGDNLDLALTRCVEEKLNHTKLTLRQRYALRRACCTAKEQLLSDPSLERVPVSVLGSGRAVVGEALSVELTREEVLQILTAGFLPITAADEMPAKGRATGLRELGLPYAADPAITRHLAAFLEQAGAAMEGSSPTHPMAKPDALLFNGGFFAPLVTRERMVQVIAAWFSGNQSAWRPKVLHNQEVESAVAVGAAYYGRVRRGSGVRVRAGNPRTYYIGLPSNDGLQGICVLPAGIEEGATLPLLEREFSVLANRPVSFTLYSSRTRHDAHGEVTALSEEDIHRHPPLVTLLRYGKKMRDLHLTVRLRARFTEVGTLELWCESRDTMHRWKLQFELRGEGSQPLQHETVKLAAETRSSPVRSLEAERLESARRLIHDVFGSSAVDTRAADTLAGQMEAELGAKRESWPVAAIRQWSDVLLEVAGGRKKSPRHEVRWLNLCGWCLRPGFGVQGDAGRIHALRRLAAYDPLFADDLQCQIEMLVMFRRIAGGINASEQQTLYRKLTGSAGGKKRGRTNRQLEYEESRLLASLEHLPGSVRASLGHEMLAKIKKEPEIAIWLWCLGRLGARVPLYGPLHSIVPAETAGHWVEVLLSLSTFTAAAESAIVMMARHTGDGSRDLQNKVREQAISRFAALGVKQETLQLLEKYVPPESSDVVQSFGEMLPPGLQLVSSPNCLLSLPALQSAG